MANQYAKNHPLLPPLASGLNDIAPAAGIVAGDPLNDQDIVDATRQHRSRKHLRDGTNNQAATDAEVAEAKKRKHRIIAENIAPEGIAHLTILITGLSNTINHPNTGLAALSNTVNALSNTVNALSNTVNDPVTGLAALSNTVTALSNTVNDPVTGLAALSNTVNHPVTGLAALSNTVNHPVSGVAALSNDVTALSNTVNDPVTGLATLSNTVNDPVIGLVALSRSFAVEQSRSINRCCVRTSTDATVPVPNNGAQPPARFATINSQGLEESTVADLNQILDFYQIPVSGGTKRQKIMAIKAHLGIII
jgi:methyl-accepting chemotaxis protein